MDGTVLLRVAVNCLEVETPALRGQLGRCGGGRRRRPSIPFCSALPVDDRCCVHTRWSGRVVR
jgi:hypothetical protein